ncbi:glycosyltransferase [Patescibacteria group bacterium]|nr:glycosyltransferase [Patescibacteria group bacterium]MBU1952094.1 glycosyltransferase [Patescibacteria group bacterium]
MKLLMLAPTPFFSDRGCHIRVLNSYLNLQDIGHNVLLLTYPLGRDMDGVETKRISKVPGYHQTKPGFSFYKPFLDFLLLFKAIKEMLIGKYDVVYAHLYEGAFIGYFLKIIFRKKLIFDNQGSLTGELTTQKTIKKNSLVFKIVYRLEKFIIQKSDEIIASNEGLKKILLDNFQVKNIVVEEDLPNDTLFNSQVQSAKLDLPKNKIVITYLGGLQLYKGLDYLLNAIASTDYRFHFLIMGYPEKDCQRIAKELGILNRITFTGKIPYEQAPAYLKLGNIAISLKTTDSGEANAKLYNYIAMGLKVICFDLPENRRILKDNGIYVRNKDTSDLVNKINMLKL